MSYFCIKLATRETIIYEKIEEDEHTISMLHPMSVVAVTADVYEYEYGDDGSEYYEGRPWFPFVKDEPVLINKTSIIAISEIE